ASSYPLYKLVSQEFIPAGGDEAEFEVTITAPEGSSVAAMDDISRALDRDIRSIPGVRLLLMSAGAGGGLGGTTVQGYVRIAPHEERVFSIGRLVHGLV